MAKFEALIAEVDSAAFYQAVRRFLSSLIGPEPPVLCMHRYPWIEGDRRVVESDDEAALGRFVMLLDVELMMSRSAFAGY